MIPRRALAEEDAQGSSSSVREAAGEEGDALMPQGALKESGLTSTDAYLTRKAGMYCDVVERLARKHLEVAGTPPHQQEDAHSAYLIIDMYHHLLRTA